MPHQHENITISDSAFPKHSWLLKAYDEGTDVPQEKYHNRFLYSARVVTENAYGMMKGRWRLLHKEVECRLDKIKYVIHAGILLHNLCLHFNDSCKPRWVLDVQRLGVKQKMHGRAENANASALNRLKVSNWLWAQEL